MTVLRTSNAPIGLDRGKPITTENSLGWVAPSDWITYTVPTASEQKVIGTVAVFNQDSNYFAVNIITTDGSQYTVDWGDGTTSDHNSNTVAEKNYTWSSISSGTLTSEGYRQAIVTITPKISGRTFSQLELSRRHSALASGIDYFSPWLSLSIAAPNATTITFVGSSTTTVTPGLAQQVQIISSNITSAINLFQTFYALQDVVFNTSATLTNTSGMFSNCRMLKVGPFFNTASVTTMSSMFNSCTSLQFVPLYNTSSVTTMSSMFSNCSALETVPFFNTALVTSMSSMFFGDYSLKSIPLWNTAACTSMSSMFYNCSALLSVPLFNTALVTNMGSMFTGTSSLETIPAFNTSAVTAMDGMFRFSSGLVFLPALNTANVTNISNIFTASGTNIREISELNLSGITSVANNLLGLGSTTATSSAGNLARAKITGNKWTQSFQNCSMGATELNEMYTSLATLNPAITNVSGNGTTVTVTVGTANISPFVAGRSVTITGVTPVAYNISGTVASVNTGAGTFTITNAATGTYVSGGTATITSDVTITVTGNPGVATDNPAIATAKGWTVTG
jgi:surface protein